MHDKTEAQEGTKLRPRRGSEFTLQPDKTHSPVSPAASGGDPAYPHPAFLVNGLGEVWGLKPAQEQGREDGQGVGCRRGGGGREGRRGRREEGGREGRREMGVTMFPLPLKASEHGKKCWMENQLRSPAPCWSPSSHTLCLHTPSSQPCPQCTFHAASHTVTPLSLAQAAPSTSSALWSLTLHSRVTPWYTSLTLPCFLQGPRQALPPDFVLTSPEWPTSSLDYLSTCPCSEVIHLVPSHRQSDWPVADLPQG